MNADNPVTATTELLKAVAPLIDSEQIGEEAAAEISKKVEALQEALANPKILGDVERRPITSFDDWEERVYDVVEFVRPNDTIVQFKIQSLTSADQQDMRKKRAAALPIQPKPRENAKGPDMNDPHYQEAMKAYELEMSNQADFMVLWILEAGLVEVKIPGENDTEKLAFLRDKVAGDHLRLAEAINDISNLTPDTTRPFLMS